MKSFIRRLMHPNAALRMGALQNGFRDIKEHAAFNTGSQSSNIDFEKLMSHEVVMPYIPKVPDLTALLEGSDLSMVEHTEEELAARFDKGLAEEAVELIDLDEEMTFKDDINVDLFADMREIGRGQG